MVRYSYHLKIYKSMFIAASHKKFAVTRGSNVFMSMSAVIHAVSISICVLLSD